MHTENHKFLEIITLPVTVYDGENDEYMANPVFIRKFGPDYDLVKFHHNIPCPEQSGQVFNLIDRDGQALPLVTNYVKDGKTTLFFHVFALDAVEEAETGYAKQMVIRLLLEAKTRLGAFSSEDMISEEIAVARLRVMADEAKASRTNFSFCYLHAFTDRLTDEERVFAEKSIVSIMKSTIRRTDIPSRMSEWNFLLIFPKCESHVTETIMSTIAAKIDTVSRVNGKSLDYELKYSIDEFDGRTDDDIDAMYELAKREVMGCQA